MSIITLSLNGMAVRRAGLAGVWISVLAMLCAAAHMGPARADDSVRSAGVTVPHETLEQIVGEWRLEIRRERMGARGRTTEETLTIRVEDGVLSASLDTPSGPKPVSDFMYHADGRLTWQVPTRAPGSDRPMNPRQRILVGPTLSYEAKLQEGTLEGFMRAYFGAAAFRGVKSGSGMTPPEITQPSAEAATPDGKAFRWLRTETFSIGGQTHRMEIYRSNLLAAALGLGPDETDISTEFALIPKGRFLMGSSEETQQQMIAAGRRASMLKDESPQREVTVNQFLMARTELTQELWRKLAHLAGLPRHPSFFAQAGDRAPVEQVSWNETRLWLTAVNDVYGLSLRMPSEAEWEYAVRAGTTTPLYNGGSPDGTEDAEQLGPIAWYLGNSEAAYPGGVATAGTAYAQVPVAFLGTQPVGQKTPNAFGLYDMLGNVLEWCADLAHGSYIGAPEDAKPWRGGDWVTGSLLNGPMTEDGPLVTARDQAYVPGRVRRGGSWRNVAQNTRAAMRSIRGPNFTDANNGIRLAASVPDDLPAPGATRD